MIKLVASDIDGTLLPEGTDQMNPEIYDAIRRLKEKGIQFVGASGRQYESMYHVFEPVADDMIFIAENGTNVMQQGKNISFVPLKEEFALEVIQFIHAQEDCRIILTAPESMYAEGRENDEFMDWLIHGYHNKVLAIDDITKKCARTNKISLYHPGSAEKLAEKAKEQFGSRMHVTLAGRTWVDFMAEGTDKGAALALLQEKLGISREETMAFGDNCNDIGMLRQAGESYAVANGHPLLKETAKYVTAPIEEDGVLRVIRERLLQTGHAGA